MKYETISIERHDRVLLASWNRPEKLNAFNGLFFKEWIELLDAVNKDNTIGVIVCTGKGKAFSSGADVGEFASASKGDKTVKEYWEKYQPVAFEAKRMISSKPIIGAINGLALGAGLTCTFWFDFNLASTEAKFSMRFSKLGLTPELDSSWLLPKLIGLQRAKEMMLTGKIYNANEALDFGLIAKIYEPHNLVDEAIKTAQSIADNPSNTLRTIKEMVFEDITSTSFDQVAQRSIDNFAHARKSDEHREALLALQEKRKPKFHDIEHMKKIIKKNKK
ncbi:MAG: enoyl-CoA hydratase/isomerase family protein [Dehalococcoidia bacterium]|tara:strand:+ start:1263 stop:2093 length:831 start_codon:yes stop_codon:yes gene_type:complete